MKVQMREIIQAIPALSKITGGDLSLRLAYQLKRNIAELQKGSGLFLRAARRKSLTNMARRKKTAHIPSRQRRSKRLSMNWRRLLGSGGDAGSGDS